jgi:ketosteroid isomerase-like protein
MKMPKSISRNSDLDSGGTRFSKWLKDSKEPWNTFKTITTVLTFIPSGDHVVVEGTSHGRISGKSWAGGKTPGGRFCNAFKFQDGRISSLHIYLDPDYTGEDEARFRWGKSRQW